jgi:hypothetical protein
MKLTRLFQCVFALLFVALTSLSVAAQDREDDIPYIPFAVTGGRADNRNYTIRFRNEDYNRLYTAINTAVPMINQLTGMPWNSQIIIVMMGSSAGENTAIGRYLDTSTAYVTRRETPGQLDPQVCHLRIFDGWAGKPLLETIITRQLFHCYQMSAGMATIEDFLDVSKFWWLQGVAEWVAYRAFPSQFPQPYHNLFDSKVDVTRARYDAFYFWEFMASAKGLGNPQLVSVQMDAISLDEEQFPLPTVASPTNLFHDWALALYNRTLPLAPPIITNDLPAGESGDLSTSIQRFSADFKNLAGFDVKEGNIGYIKISGMEDGNYAASIQVGAALVRLTDDDPHEFCPSDSGNVIVLSRGQGDAGSTPTLTLEWGQNPSPNACKPKKEEPASGDSNVSCMIGTWVTVSYPASVIFATMDLSQFTWTFQEDFTMDMAYIIVAKQDRMTINSNVSFTGTYEVNGAVGNVLDASFSMEAVPGGLYTGTYDGTVTDFTKQFYSTASLAVWNPKDGIFCDETTLSWDAQDGSGEFILERVE